MLVGKLFPLGNIGDLAGDLLHSAGLRLDLRVKEYDLCHLFRLLFPKTDKIHYDTSIADMVHKIKGYTDMRDGCFGRSSQKSDENIRVIPKQPPPKRVRPSVPKRLKKSSHSAIIGTSNIQQEGSKYP